MTWPAMSTGPYFLRWPAADNNLRGRDALVAALEAAPAEVRVTIEALTVFPTAFDEESAAAVLTGVVGTGASCDADAAACKKSLDAAVTAGLLHHDPRSDTYKVGLGRSCLMPAKSFSTM